MERVHVKNALMAGLINVVIMPVFLQQMELGYLVVDRQLLVINCGMGHRDALLILATQHRVGNPPSVINAQLVGLLDRVQDILIVLIVHQVLFQMANVLNVQPVNMLTMVAEIVQQGSIVERLLGRHLVHLVLLENIVQVLVKQQITIFVLQVLTDHLQDKHLPRVVDYVHLVNIVSLAPRVVQIVLLEQWQLLQAVFHKLAHVHHVLQATLVHLAVVLLAVRRHQHHVVPLDQLYFTVLVEIKSIIVRPLKLDIMLLIQL
jgi:hypothetical protein